MTTSADLRAAVFLKGVTWLRVLLVPVIMALVLAGPDRDYAFAVAGVLFAIAALTDFVDGFLARRWAQTSVFGNFLDTTADKLLVSGTLIALVAVDRASPWIALIIVGRELLIMGLKGAVAAGGELVKPSIWGKAKANVQFVAIFLAIIRPSVELEGLFLDQYAMIVAAAITVVSAVEYLVRLRGAITAAVAVPPGPALVTGGSGLVGGAVLRRLVAEGRDVRALARSDLAADAVRALGADPVRGDVLDPASLADAARGCSSLFHVAGVNAMCLRDPRPMYRTNVEGTANAVRAAAEAGVGRVILTSSAAAIGEARGVVGREDAPHRGSYLSHYERSKHLAERTALRLAAELGVDLVCVNPSSVQGPGRTEGSARLLLDIVNGRLPVLVETTISIVDIDDCAEGHVRSETRGAPGERYVLNGASVSTREAVEILRRLWGRPERVRWLPASLARAGGAGAEAVGRLLRRDVPVCREAVRTVLHGHRYDGSRAERELGLRYRPIEETLERTLSWYAERGLIPARAARDDGPRT